MNLLVFIFTINAVYHDAMRLVKMQKTTKTKSQKLRLFNKRVII